MLLNMFKFLTILGLCVIPISSFSQRLGFPSLKEVVAFIYIKNDTGLVPQGSGFFVSVPINKQQYVAYLVTAKHVIKTNDQKHYLQSIFLRVERRKDSSLTYIEIPIHVSAAHRNTFVHPDSTVDIAVISQLPSFEIFKYKALPHTYITTKKDFDSLGISEGDEVFFTGMFAHFLGARSNFPISRFGRVALVTNEKVFWNGYPRNLHLLETTTYWGNSGAPVYFSLQRKPVQQKGLLILGTNTVVKLAGIMSGFSGQVVPGAFVETKVAPAQIQNLGISAVTPAYLLWDILFSEELIKQRQ
jgi:hypothetical protein